MLMESRQRNIPLRWWFSGWKHAATAGNKYSIDDYIKIVASRPANI
jgi:hypothetical protein